MKMAPNSLIVALCYNKIGVLLDDSGDLNGSLKQYKAPNGTTTTTSNLLLDTMQLWHQFKNDS
jgi:hypothetical protein